MSLCKLVIGTLVASDERVQIGLEELQDLKGVWSELAKIWEKVDELKDKPWLSVQPRKVDEYSSHLLFLISSITYYQCLGSNWHVVISTRSTNCF